MNLALATFREADYPEILRISEDAQSMEPTWRSWRQEADMFKLKMEASGFKVVEIIIEPLELEIYCMNENLPINGGSRASLAQKKHLLL